MGISLYQKNHLDQTMHPIVLYNHAKNWKDPKSSFGEKAKTVKNNLLGDNPL